MFVKPMPPPLPPTGRAAMPARQSIADIDRSAATNCFGFPLPLPSPILDLPPSTEAEWLCVLGGGGPPTHGIAQVMHAAHPSTPTSNSIRPHT